MNAKQGSKPKEKCIVVSLIKGRNEAMIKFPFCTEKGRNTK